MPTSTFKTWLITGSSRGLGNALAKAVLAAGPASSPPRVGLTTWRHWSRNTAIAFARSRST